MSNLLFIILGIIIIAILSFVLLVIIQIKFKFVFAGYCVLILILSPFFLINYFQNNTNTPSREKPPIQYKPIAAPRITNVETYFEGYEAYPRISNIKQTYPFNKDTDTIRKLTENPDIYILSKPNNQVIKGTFMNKSTYRFEGLNGLDKCQYLDKVPKNLSPYMRRAFNDWKYFFNSKEIDAFALKFKIQKNPINPVDMYGDPDSVFYKEGEYNCFDKDTSIYELNMHYEGPQYLLEEDKDFYISEVKISSIFEEGIALDRIYYLHFNPVKQYITLYTEKMNTKFTYEKNKTKI